MTSDNYTNNRLNYNSAESAKSLPHVEKLFSTRRKNISYAYAQNILSKEIFRTLLVMLLMVTGAAGVWAQTEISSLAGITDPEGNYTLSSSFSTTGTPSNGIGTASNPFKGTIDGQLTPITGTWDKPLFDYVENAVIKNVIIGNASISASDNAGAIAANATGATRIYNCGILDGSIGGSGKTGGIVGFLDGSARVVNCYSFATITGGTDVAGIVGYNNYLTKASDIRTMVMNCMFYGDITGGTTVAPVYGGQIINNLNSGGLNTFNYYAYEKLKTKDITYVDDNNHKYNCALAVKDDYLNRFEFYRLLLNSNKKLAAIYITGNAADANILAKWVLETADRSIDNPKPYPILKPQGKYPSIINMDVENAPDSVTVGPNKGGKLGKTLTVNIQGTGVTTSSLPIERTDKDFDRFNYNYDKIQLPYFNDVGTGNYTNYNVVTGWKIIAMGPSTEEADPYTSANYPATGVKDFPDHNYADRKSRNKDLYSVSGRVFSQGAYFDVPYGVTSITIEPYWGKAAYIADERYDVVYNTGYQRQNVTQLGQQATNKSTTYPGLGEQKVYTSMSDALGSLTGVTNPTVYDYAIVLVGNFHQNGIPSNGDKPFTMMSVDWDNDHEPDYSMIYHHNGRTVISPIRFDFLNIPGTAQAQKPKDTSSFQNFTIFKTKGWFETTNTCLVYSNQVEYENKNGVTKKDAPLILLGGDFEQFVSTQSDAVDGKTTYIHVGGNVHIQSFGLGTHGDGKQSTPHIPVSVTGGEYDGFYLSGTYNQDANVRTNDNAECYISGGHFVEAAGASQEQIDGSVYWQIYNADIDAFYGGGVNAAKPITGDVTVDIFNSHVTLYCGGPKFGDMQPDKKVTTNAEGCVFGKYFGGGYGGTSYSRKKYYDLQSTNWSTWAGKFTSDRGKYFDGKTTNSKEGGSGNDQYGKKGIGVATDVDYEFFAWSTGGTGGRFYVNFASFSLAACNNVESNLKGCTINENFYGGGSYGEVKGKATSVLDGCTVKGDVFGGGYSATLPTVKVRQTPAFVKNPNINKFSGMFEPGVLADYEPTEFDWKMASDYNVRLSNNNSGSDMTNHYLYTDVDLTALGKVGKTDLTVKDNCQITGSVYGGGDESEVKQNTLVNIQNESTGTISNVYGGGKIADVVGDTEVNLTSGSITRDVYGGGALADVNSAIVNINGGTIAGNVFGGGEGRLASGTQGNPGYLAAVAAQNFGNATVTIGGGTIGTAVYGGSNINGVLKGDASVTITGGTVGTSLESGSTNIADAVFGGGFGEPTLVEGDVTVNIGREKTGDETEHVGTATIHGNVYGGSALGNTNASRPESALVFNDTKKTAVNLLKGTINGNVYGGGLGQKNGVNNAIGNILSYVGGDVKVLLDGAKITSTYTGEDENRMPLTGQIFGANNLNGTPKGHVMVHVKRTVDSDKNTETDRDARTTYDVAAVYGGGNQADYIPTDALLDPDADEGNPLKIEKATAEVLIEGCDLTSIEYVYGGGNAAAVPATDVTILGSYIIKWVFGGGNGKSTATFNNPGANIGTYNNGATSYGTGKASTQLVGGHIIYVFGGSDTKGNVRGGTSITMPDQSLYPSPTYNCCNVRDVREIYGAGNQAEQDGPVTLILGCVNNMSHVYGGARMADVKGGVDLVVTSGHFEGVYGGNDRSGTIQGPITLTIEETGCDPLVIDNLYLGGNQAAYSVYGYKNTGTADTPVLVARNKAEYDALTTDQKTAEGLPYADPILNIVSCTRIGMESGDDLGGAFGGGYGAGATMYGNPTVNVNMIPGKFAEQITRTDIYPVSNNENALGIIRNVYGGGEQANVEGNTTVNICTEPTVTVRSSMGTLVENEPTPVQGALITDNVFGAGKGLTSDIDLALVSGNTTVTMANGFVAKSVYGGGQLSQVGGDTHITVSGGTIGTSGLGGITYGNVYGGGLGDEENAQFGLVQGNTNIIVQDLVADEAYHGAHSETAVGTILTSPNILHNIYGGGAYGSVGTFTFNSTTNETTCAENTGATKITITGGTIGTDGHENGMVFGASRGDVGAPDGTHDRLAWVDNTTVVIGTKDAETGPYIKGSVYGGGENGHTFHDASVTIHSGMVGITETMPTDPEGQGGALYPYRGNVYGGGCGTDKYHSGSVPEGHTANDGQGDKYNPLSGIVQGNATVLIDGGHVVRDVYGAGAMGSVSGSTHVTIAGNAEIGAENSGGGYVFAAARGDIEVPTFATVGSSNLTISGGTVWMDAYGGGKNGYVNGAVTVNLTGGTVKGDVYGGGALAKTNTKYDGSHETYKTYKTNMTLSGATIVGSLYGGGLGDLASSGTGHSDVEADVNGPVKVSVTSGSAVNVFGCNNLNGAPKSTVEVEIGAKDGDNLSGSATISGSVYGGGNMAAYTGDPTVKLYGGTVNTNVYGGGLGASAIVNGSTSVTMEGGTVRNDLYGGGSQADVTGSVDVSIAGGTVTHDVYGGGALANTNTGNWTGDDGSPYYVVKNDLATETYRVKEDVAVGDDVAGLYTRDSSTSDYVAATGTAQANTVYYEKLPGAPVAGYYTESGDVYTRITNSTATADGSTTYYKKMVKGDWVATPPVDGTSYYTTTVSLTGGLIGNAYGGGLGNATTAANVYGDVTVTVNAQDSEGVQDPTKGVAFIQNVEDAVVGGVTYPTYVSGRVFGGNNHNGTPTGNITVHVYSTRQLDNNNNILPGHGSSDRKYSYEIQSVYGGGNQADYLPADGKKTQVIIEGCDVTSIEKVYGGGNSAVVPETDVLIRGAYDIGYAFGGGNGGQPIKKSDGNWYENEGAIVIGLASIICKGGKIGQVFGGGDAKGSCGNTNAVTQQDGDCALNITRLYGAGNKGDVSSVNIVLAACSTGEAIEYVHGGSYNAHVHGDVHLTITSGILKNVYGGNDARGGIGGNITVDIEETNGCNPIIIQNLVGGGNEAPYPGTYTDHGVEVPYPDDHRGKITVNVKSATRIDNIYGGSFMAEANADTEVNINMIRGNLAGQSQGVTLPQEFSYIPNISNITYNEDGKTIHCLIDDAIGTIGNVYGGGNMGLVKGNATVNIGASNKVQIMDRDESGKIKLKEGGVVDLENGQNITGTIQYKDETPRGAHITGDVFGGGREANVTGNTFVNICSDPSTHLAVAEGAEKVTINNGSVYGGGSAADVKGNATVRMSGGYVFDGVYGGGLMGSVGTFTTTTAVTTESNNVNHASHAGCIGKPTECTAGGLCTVVVNGGQVGPVEVAKEDGGMKNEERYFKEPSERNGPVDYGFVFGAGRGEVENPAEDADADFRTYVNATDVTIGGTALIMASVYGGGENGRVLTNTHVKIQGGQIGCSAVDGSDNPVVYSEEQWTSAIDAVTSENPTDIDAAAAGFKECAHWDYGKDTDGKKDDFSPYDPLYFEPLDGESETSSHAEEMGYDGHTYYGNVFGGGSGYYPYEIKDGSTQKHDWLRSAGVVYGNSTVDITGGHILTNVYGGNETTDVMGKCTVNMSGGTLGVPRTLQQIADHPVTCYLFGAGKGDQRTHFNTWTNVNEVEVNVTGGTIFGSVFGGGEDGHVLEDITVNIGDGAKIGTWGTSYVDGNIFGGGRGFSGEALTAGSVGGNINVNITGGKMLGSVYGGGRLASVGIGFVAPTLEDGTTPNPYYGLINDDKEGKEYGHVKVKISGGTIGGGIAGTDSDKDYFDMSHSGNVFGGSMGRNTLLDGKKNPLWPKLAVAKLTEVTISDNADIRRNVYGGGEYGVVRNQATVNIEGGIVGGSVFGSGYGSDDDSDDMRVTITAGGYESIPTLYYTFTPMIWNGCVSGNTFVNVSGGWVKRNVYGGGELASVGLFNFNSTEDGEYNYITRHDDPENGFALSWPYEFEYIAAAPTDTYAPGGNEIGGKATVKITGGRIGITGKDVMVTGGEKEDNGDVYGGSKGISGDRYKMAFCANVKETSVTVNYESSVTVNYESSTANPENYKTGVDILNKGENDCIAGSVYGGGENGHVIENTKVLLKKGLIGHAIYGGGKGKDTFKHELNRIDGGGTYTADIYSVTAGKVYGNTYIEMEGGYVVRNIYGGGNMASTGKGNYSGGADDYSTSGYGETLTGNLWDNGNEFSQAFLSSGKTYVNIKGGQVGYIDATPAESMKDGLPYGNVFGGARGASAPNVEESPRYLYAPLFYSGYVNETHVHIYDSVGVDAPKIYGSVYGGGQDGHVRRDTHVIIDAGEIGEPRTGEGAPTALTSTDLTDPQWLHRGNVYGAGSGIGKYEYDFNNDGKFDGKIENYGQRKITLKETDYSNSAGSVTRFSTVEINGGTIHRNVYGGGSLAPVGPPKIPPITDYASRRDDTATANRGKQSLNLVNITGGIIGSASDYEAGYGGNVYAASRGLGTTETNPTQFSTSVWTEVNILPNETPTNSPVIAGDVYGGGEASQVFMDALVNLKGGDVAHDVYGGGKGVKAGIGTEGIAADIGRNTTVLLNEGVATTARGCSVERIFGCNNLNGTPKGHALVHVFATQNTSKESIGQKFSQRPAKAIDETLQAYLKKLIDATKSGEGYVDPKITESAIVSAEGTYGQFKDIDNLSEDNITTINTAIDNVLTELRKLYDVQAVYGGGDLAPYEPTDAFSTDLNKKANARTEVIIEGCDVTSIKQVYGSGNAASTPATDLTVHSAYEIEELFGGGNGKDPFQLDDGKWYENPGANVGYKDFTHYVKTGETGFTATTHGSGTKEEPYKAIENDDATNKDLRQAYYMYGEGEARTNVIGGRIHYVYGGSNEKGNISTMALSIYDTSDECPLSIDETYGAGKNAEIDGEVNITMDCVNDNTQLFGGSKNADVNSDITLNVTNGTFTQVFGGNNTSGNISGSITVNVKESGCKPIFIEELYGGGYLADYSIYGYYNKNAGTDGDPDMKPRNKAQYESDYNAAISGLDESASDYEEKKKDALVRAGLWNFPKANPRINIISATKIGNIFGGGYQATVIGSPHVNVNMEEGMVTAKYAEEAPAKFAVGPHTETKEGKTYTYEVKKIDGSNNAILAIGTIGYIFGGGNEADIIGNTYVEIGTGKHHDIEGNLVDIEPFRNAANITGTVYGGGNLGHVGEFTFADATYHTSHPEVPVGKPISCTEGTGECHVTISNGSIGPDDMLMTREGGPDDDGYVFGAGKGTVDLDKATGATDEEKLIALGNIAFVDSTEVIINGTAFIKGSVYGGGYDGHVLHNTGVKISGNCQIGNGFVQMDNDGNYLTNPLSMNRPYTEDEWTAGKLIMGDNDRDELKTLVSTTNSYNSSLPECASWPYGKEITYDGKTSTIYAPYDKFAMPGTEMYDETHSSGGGYKEASDGHTFYGNVFGGGSGYFPYAAGEWLETSGQVEGNTWVEITGGHILTNIYGGNEMTNVLGDAHISFGGTATLGVPRTLGQIAKHPVTCYLFGAGKGDTRVFFNKMTNVQDVHLDVNGGTIYGSVFGGGEDGHVMGNVYMNIKEGAKIGTWGTSYVDGNVFGGGRGFTGDAYTAGNVAGSVTMNITGGTMLGSIYGGGRLGSVGYGLYMQDDTTGGYGEMRKDTKMDDGTDAPEGMFPKGRGRVEVNISGGTIGNTYEFIMPMESNIPTGLASDFTTWTDANWTTWKNHNYVPNTLYDTTNGRLLHTKGGNVFTGGMGRREKLDGTVINYTGIEWPKLGNVKSTKLTISGDAWIMGNVYGGGEIGAVRPYKETETIPGGTTTIDIQGGIIGTEITGSTPVKATVPVPESGISNVKYTFGSVLGGGYGTEAEQANVTSNGNINRFGALIEGNTNVSMSGGHVRGSIYGGGELAAVEGDTYVTINGGKVGRNEVKPMNDEDPGYVRFGGMTMGNVYGGGMGKNTNALLGLVKGNTNVLIQDATADATYAAAHEDVSEGDVISSPEIYHNIYGGGALGSVGDFSISNGTTPAGMPAGVPYWTIGPEGASGGNTGVANVTITGGTIGISGRDNGLVFGSSRGDISKPTGSPAVDQYDKVAWVKGTVVTIGKAGRDRKTPFIRGSVYGGGENGHNYQNAIVNVLSGTIGIPDKNPATNEVEPWWDFETDELNEEYRAYRGNVYGAGSGSDTYTDDNGKEHYNPRGGMVGGSTVVNIMGGHIVRSVYGGGAMASLGNITNVRDTLDVASNVEGAGTAKHTSGFTLSWPYKFEFATMTGKATVNVSGGHIGTLNVDGGDVYGSARGIAGDRFATAHMAYTKETEVNINYPTTAEMTSEDAINENFDLPCITGSVHGGGENGFVYDNAKVTVNGGLIGHSVYGAGKGKGTYKEKLLKIGATEGSTNPKDYYEADIYSLISGRVMGNTEVIMNGGYVGRNVYGGGNMGSVGKGNYASGTDDYYPAGYGETIAEGLWTPSTNFDPDKPITPSYVPESAPHNTPVTMADYFLSSGKTTVKVYGGTVGFIDKEDPTTSVKNNLPYGNVFGGCAGEAAPNILETPRYHYSPAFFSGYVNETDVTIGKTRADFTTDNEYQTYLESGAPKILASVYGGGQDGHVRRDTKVVINNGEIGLPFTAENKALLKSEDPNNDQWLHRGNVYGAGSGVSKYAYDFNYDKKIDDSVEGITYHNNPVKEEDYSNSAGSVTRFTQVDINGGTIHNNVYGGGSLASVGPPTIPPTRTDMADKKDDNTHGPGWQSQNTVNIGDGTGSVTIGTPDNPAGTYNPDYGGNVFGGSRGNATLDYTQFGTSVWTIVKIKNGATIMNNVFGGGDAGIVKKDSDVIVGGE